MNICFVVDGLNAGGAGRVVSILANNLAENHSITICSFFSSEVSYSLRNDIKVVSLINNQAGKNTDGFIGRVRKLRAVVIENRIDLIVSFLTELNVYSVIVSKITNHVKTIISERNDPHVVPYEKRVRFLRDIFYPLADGYVFQTKDARDYFPRRIRDRSKIIFNPISNQISCKHDPQNCDNIIASVGRLNSQKNYPLAIRAVSRILREHSDYKYEIYGEGEDRSHLEELIKYYGMEGRIILKGHVKDVIERISKARIFLMTSNYEGMSNALIEAMVIGLPVVSSDHPIGGARELINDGENGYLFPVNNEDECYKRIKILIDDETKREVFSANSCKVADLLSTSKIVEDWEQYISGVVK